MYGTLGEVARTRRILVALGIVTSGQTLKLAWDNFEFSRNSFCSREHF